MFRPTLTLIAVFGLATSALAAPPCATATSECAEWLTLAGGPQRSMIYRSHPLEQKNDAIVRVFVLIHGAGRDADNYFRSAMAAGFLAGALDDTLVISPRIASNDGASCRDVLSPGEISWHCSTWRSGGRSVSHESVTSFDFVDEILRKVARKDRFPNLRAIVVAGHSAGGQVVNRYEMTNQVHDTLGVPVTYVVSNPSSYAWPDETRPTSAAYSRTAGAPGYSADPGPNMAAFRTPGDARNCTAYDRWPFGLNDRSGYSAKQTVEQIRTQLAARATTYLLGDLDILPLGGFDGSCPAMLQGPTRFARGEAFARYVNEQFSAKHTLVVVPLCGHNARCIFTSEAALPVIFPKP